MILRISVFALIFGSVISTACDQYTDRMNMKAFEAESNRAKKFFLDDNDHENAEIHYRSALQIAEKMNWTDGIVMAKKNLSKVAASKKKYSEAEKILIDAKDLCKSRKDCYSGQLRSIYDDLIFLYLFWQKDISKASNIVEEVIESRQKLSESEDVSSMLIEYNENMKTAGFEHEADVWEKRLKTVK